MEEYRPKAEDLGLPPSVDLSDAEILLLVEAGMDWMRDNTVFRFAPDKEVPASVRLFLCKFCELGLQAPGVQSESIGGMSQSFRDTDENLAVMGLAMTYLGPWTSSVRFVTAGDRWQ